MIIRHSLPERGWTKVDRYVFTHGKLSDGAKVLYGYLCGMRTGDSSFDTDIAEELNISQQTLTKRKKELKDVDLLLVDQIGSRVYVAYIGHTNLPASLVKKRWVKRERDF